MKYTKKSLLLTLLIAISLGYHHTSTAGIFKNLKTNFKNWTGSKEETISLKQAVPEKCGISITNLKGDVVVKFWKQPNVVIEAQKKGAEAALNATTVKRELIGNKLAIQTVYKDPKAKCSVNYNILVPETARLQSVTTEKGNIIIANAHHGTIAKTEHGNITLESVSGEVKTSAHRGSITIGAAEINPEDKILAITGKGNIKLTIPPSSNANIYAKTTSGTVNSEIPITTQSRTMKFNKTTLAQLKREASGKIGQGGSSIKLHTGKGNIILENS